MYNLVLINIMKINIVLFIKYLILSIFCFSIYSCDNKKDDSFESKNKSISSQPISSYPNNYLKEEADPSKTNNNFQFYHKEEKAGMDRNLISEEELLFIALYLPFLKYLVNNHYPTGGFIKTTIKNTWIHVKNKTGETLKEVTRKTKNSITSIENLVKSEDNKKELRLKELYEEKPLKTKLESKEKILLAIDKIIKNRIANYGNIYYDISKEKIFIDSTHQTEFKIGEVNNILNTKEGESYEATCNCANYSDSESTLVFDLNKPLGKEEELTLSYYYDILLNLSRAELTIQNMDVRKIIMKCFSNNNSAI